MQNLQISEHFIGRSNELKIFTQWLADDHAPRILYFYDALEEPEKKGGIGKTWLLRKCQENAQKEHPELAIASIDFFNVGDRNGVVVAERIVEELQRVFPDWVPTFFLEAIAEYRNVDQPEKEEAAEVRSALFKALTTDLHYLDRQLGKEQKALLVFYDTYELIETNPIIAALRFSQKFPDTYQFKHMYAVIAGRNALDWTHLNWQGREQEVQTVALTPFSQTEMAEYIDAESFYTINRQSEQTKALYERTEGRPILIGLVTDVLNKRIMTLESLVNIPVLNFEPHLVMQINNLEHPLNWVILFMTHVYHRFNMDILNWILQEADLRHLVQDVQYDELVKNLPTLSFVRRPGHGEDFVLHDEMRRLVNEHCWPSNDRDLRYRNAISRSMIGYYEYATDKEPNQQKRQTYRAERLFHMLFLDIDEGFQYFMKHFYDAISLRQSPFARSILLEIQPFEGDMTSQQRNRLQLALATLLRAEENSSAALAIYQTLEQQADEQWIADYRVNLLSGKGRCYLDLSRVFEAIDCFTQCLEIDRERGRDVDIANRLGWLGYAYRRRGQFDTAVRYYEESIILQKHLNNQVEYANMFNYVGYVYRLQGKLDEALLRCKIALRLRKDLYSTSKVSEVTIGLTLSTIGQVYLDMDDILHAEESFQHAFEIYSRAKHRKFIAGIMNRFGQVEMVKNNWPSAKDWFEKAQVASADIDSEAYIFSLDKQGRVLAKQKHWAEAVTFFEQAVNIARQVHDDYQCVESLIDLAEALAYQDQHQQVQQLLQEAELICRKWNYFHLLGHAAEFQGDIDHNAGRYEDAFAHYKEYCYHMAQRNTFEYGKALRKLTNQLVSVPTDQLHPIVDSLITYWSAQNMDKIHPDFVAACKDIGDSL